MERYRPRQTPIRQRLRTHGTPAEARLGMALSGRKLRGRRFRRQYGIGSYVLDGVLDPIAAHVGSGAE